MKTSRVIFNLTGYQYLYQVNKKPYQTKLYGSESTARKVGIEEMNKRLKKEFGEQLCNI